MIINVESIAKRLDSKVKQYDETFVMVRDVVDSVNENCDGASLTLHNTYPNIKISVDPFGNEIIISIDEVKRSMATHNVDMKNAILGIIYDGINKS